MSSVLKIFNFFWICLLFGIQLKFAKCQIGEGTMDLSDLDKCFRATTCLDDVFVEARKCYSMLGEEVLQKGMGVMRKAAKRANITLKTFTMDGMRQEYCAFTEEQKRACYDEVVDPLLDMYAGLCMSPRTKKQCDNLENGLDCGFTLMEKYAKEGRCEISEDARK